MEGKRSKARTSAEIIADNDDLLMETILLRLPTKPLIRFKLVCKHWHSVISSPCFSSHHTRRRRPKPQPSFILRTIPIRFFYFSPTCKASTFHPFRFDSPYTKILQSCNGLLLLESRNSPYAKKDFRMYNPTTKESRVVEIETDTYIAGVCLAFDPSVSIHYKFICVYQPNYVVVVYDSESGQWTSMGTPFPSNINTLLINGIYRNNRLYWIRPTSKSFYFDLQTGRVGSVPRIKTPCRKHGEINKKYIMESNQHIHCVAIYLRPHRKSLLVFELLDDNSGWFELYKVDLNPVAAALPEMNGSEVSVLGIVRGETEEESFVLLHVPGKVICCRFCDGSFEVVLDVTTSAIYNEGRLQFNRCDTHQFIESLAPL